MFMAESYTHSEKDELLRERLQLLANRKIAEKWAASQQPYSDLLQECQILISDLDCQEKFSIYLRENPIIQETVETTLATIAMAAKARWQDVPMPLQLLARRGWYINRWLPTFLIFDGPLGRFLRKEDHPQKPDSPLYTLLKKDYAKYPTLAQARDVFNHKVFKQVRDGVGHWSFLWHEEDGVPQLDIFDRKSGKKDITIKLLEAEALHLVAFSVIEVLDKEIFSRSNPRH
jgi:hypothetical protein